tara:strand:- start:502 stop:729 length:228 start_codon:yes stop_codon:yes gene_type:complete
MTVKRVINKLLTELKDELNKKENKCIIENDILEPIIENVLTKIYPYIIGLSLLYLIMFISIMMIFVLNIKIYLYQ